MERTADAPLFRVQTFDSSDIEAHTEAIEALERRMLDVVLIRNVFPADFMQVVGERIHQHEPPFYIFPPIKPESAIRKGKHLYGMTLVMADGRMDEYFRVAASVRLQCQELFRGGLDYDERMRQIFSRLGRGRPVLLPRDLEGRDYMPATVRILPPGTGIDLHADNNLGHHPAYSHLRSMVAVDEQLSFFVTVAAPDAGGELVLYARQWGAHDDTPGKYVTAMDDSMVAEHDSMTLKPGAGDLILFAGGRIYHRVAEVRGARPRYTMGGFLASALHGNELYYWS